MTGTRPISDLSILITDDDPGMREVLREIVTGLGPYHVRTASCGDEALKIAANEPLHLALLDMNMPRYTGLETLRLMRQFHLVLPAILITADATHELTVQASAAQVYSVISKPFRTNVVKATVVRALMRFYGAEVVSPGGPMPRELGN
jgi:two-component system, response regulator PdtaR